MSYGGNCIGSGFSGGALGGGYVCAPGGGFGYGNVRFGHLGGGFGICNEAPLLSCDEKMTMQNLNDRLASYLDKVRCLEEENAQLECKIREWYDRQGPLNDPKDYGCYYQQIEDLKNQIICATVENSKLVLDIDNNRMTADDFRMKYETELALCQNVEADINGLRQVLDQLTLFRSDLEAQLESLREELCCLKKNHEEEVKHLKSQATGDVSVEVNTCPGPDLKKVLEELRCQYETMIENNRREVEKWYECKMEEVNQEVCNSSKEVEDCNNQVIDLRRQIQTLEIDLQAQLSLRDTLQGSLAETECRYNNHLAEIQNQISCVEQQLAELRAEMECQNREYRDLLDVKCRLEQEIQTYRSTQQITVATAVEVQEEELANRQEEEQLGPLILTRPRLPHVILVILIQKGTADRPRRKTASSTNIAIATLSSKLSDLKSKSKRSLHSNFYCELPKLTSAMVDNRKLLLDIHYNQLTADDFKMKYEIELIFHQDVEGDIKSLLQVLDQLTLCRSDLETQLESLQEELCCLKKSHGEKVELLKNKASENFNVEVNSDLGSDLQKVLDDLRKQYEAIIEKNRREAEKWYESKRDTLQDSLAETQRQYNSYLTEIQNQISCVEERLTELRAETERQNQKYRKLLDAKCLLEQEIKTYHSLLEGGQLDPE
ncbi:hypothetical protein JD844_002086 [Phrynosoma platyrhinos]|uniref:IF rod domain-containing protein n=1 Tax=Phrynosoma platyrhinos TaxID=52577 RepID=A0ABQ7TAS9_PHRPL|nr:hypothetical protein JD844_002086 [Phrynosoma platyrhinos]